MPLFLTAICIIETFNFYDIEFDLSDIEFALSDFLITDL